MLVCRFVSLYGQVYRTVHFLFQQGEIKDFFHILDEMEREAGEVAVGDFLYVFAVLFADEDVGDAGTFRGEDFFLDAAYGEHSAT